MPINRSGADVMIRMMAEDAASAKFKALEQEVDKLDAKMNKFSSDNEKRRQEIKILGNDSSISLMAIVQGFGAVASAAVAMGKAWQFSEQAAQLERLRASSDALAEHYGANMTDMVSTLRTASQGTIADTDLMLSANKAMMLGVTANSDQMANLLQIAALRGRAMGEDVTKAFNDIVVGIGRMSPRILDNLGIVIDSDTAYEKYAESIGNVS